MKLVTSMLLHIAPKYRRMVLLLQKDVENDIRFALLKDKKAELISAEFNKNNGAGKTIDDIARSMGLTVQEATQINFRSYTVPGAGTEPALIAAASVAKQGAVSGPVKGNEWCLSCLTANNITAAQGEDVKALQDRLTVNISDERNI